MLVHLPQKFYQALIAAIRNELRQGLARAEEAVRRQRVITYWHIGRHIHRFLAQDPGSDAIHLTRIAEDLDYSLDVVRKILKFYRSFPQLPAQPPLSWSQYRALLTAPVAQRSALLKKAIAEGIGSEELYALISAGRHRLPAGDAKSAGKLDYTRGKLYIYKTLQGKHRRLKKGEIMVDGGFKWRRKVKAGPDSRLTGGHIVRSVKTEDGRYLIDFFYMRTKAADPQIIAREGIFLNQELLDLGLAKLYPDARTPRL